MRSAGVPSGFEREDTAYLFACIVVDSCVFSPPAVSEAGEAKRRATSPAPWYFARVTVFSFRLASSAVRRWSHLSRARRPQYFNMSKFVNVLLFLVPVCFCQLPVPRFPRTYPAPVEVRHAPLSPLAPTRRGRPDEDGMRSASFDAIKAVVLSHGNRARAGGTHEAPEEAVVVFRRPNNDDRATTTSPPRDAPSRESPRARSRTRARSRGDSAARTARPRRRGRPPQPARARPLPREQKRRAEQKAKSKSTGEEDASRRVRAAAAARSRRRRSRRRERRSWRRRNRGSPADDDEADPRGRGRGRRRGRSKDAVGDSSHAAFVLVRGRRIDRARRESSTVSCEPRRRAATGAGPDRVASPAGTRGATGGKDRTWRKDAHTAGGDAPTPCARLSSRGSQPRGRTSDCGRRELGAVAAARLEALARARCVDASIKGDRG